MACKFYAVEVNQIFDCPIPSQVTLVQIEQYTGKLCIHYLESLFLNLYICLHARTHIINMSPSVNSLMQDFSTICRIQSTTTIYLMHAQNLVSITRGSRFSTEIKDQYCHEKYCKRHSDSRPANTLSGLASANQTTHYSVMSHSTLTR